MSEWERPRDARCARRCGMHRDLMGKVGVACDLCWRNLGVVKANEIEAGQRLPQTMPQTTTTSHTNHTQGNRRLPHHPDHHIPFPNHQSLRPTNPPSLRHQHTQPPIPKRIHPYPTGTHDPQYGDLGHLGHTGPGPFGTTVNHDSSIFNYNRIPGT